MQVKICESVLPDFFLLEELLQYSKNQQMSNFGPLYYRFQSELKDYLKLDSSKKITITSSGHTALMTALYLCNTKSVLIPAYTFASTYQASKFQGINTILEDVEIETGTFSIKQLEKYKFNIDTVIIVCPLSSIPPNIIDISSWCIQNKKKLIIDGAATFGTIGSHFNIGDAYCLSFHATKNLPIGEGGCVIHDSNLEDKARQYISFGLDKNKKVISAGLNAKVSEYTCAIGLCLLSVIEPYINKRLNNTSIYINDIVRAKILPSIKNTVYSCFPVYFQDKEEAVIKIDSLRSRGYEVIQYYKVDNKFPNSYLLYKTNICLPCHSNININNINDIINIINK